MVARSERLRFLSGVLLVSPDPARLVRFYRDVLGLPLEEERHGGGAPHWGCELADVHFAIHPVEDYPEDPTVGTGSVKLAFMVFDLPGFVEWLRDCEVDLCYEPQPLGTGSMVTAVRDPDGNLIELTQLAPSWLDHLRVRRDAGHDLHQVWTSHLDDLTGPA